MRRLLDAAHSRGLRVILDMVLNHTSDQHPWFIESRASRDNPRRDFYIWRRAGAKAGCTPNNWRSLVGQRGWHYDATTDEWYFASFLPFQPDLNYRNPAVQQAMLDMVRHWLAQGFDGLRLDVFTRCSKTPTSPITRCRRACCPARTTRRLLASLQQHPAPPRHAGVCSQAASGGR